MDALRGNFPRRVFRPNRCLRRGQRKLRYRPVSAPLCMGLSVHRFHVAGSNLPGKSPLRSGNTGNEARGLRRSRLLNYSSLSGPYWENYACLTSELYTAEVNFFEFLRRTKRRGYIRRLITPSFG